MNLLAIVGSPRKNGNTDFLVDEALNEAQKQGISTEKIFLGEYLVGGCLGHENCEKLVSCTQKDDMDSILEKFEKADGVILATPVYYYNVTAQMKAFIDRNYFLYKKSRIPRARCLGIIVVAECEGIEDTLHTLQQFVDSSLQIAPDKRFIVSGFAGRIGEAKNNPELIENARNLGKSLAAALGKQ